MAGGSSSDSTAGKTSTSGGHVFSAKAAATVEIFIQVSDTPIERTPDEDTGLNLWRV